MKTQIFKPLSNKQDLPYLQLVKRPTPTYQLKNLSKYFGHSNFSIKREDQTSDLYGGNKVRNLEFVLAHAIINDFREVITPVPRGSNFTAALASETRSLGLKCHLAQFKAKVNPQINATQDFCLNYDAQIENNEGVLGPVKAITKMGAVLLKNKKMLYIPAGASSILGAAGHAKAFLELANQGTVPDYIITGIGTCGTTAGLLAGIKIAGGSTKVIGVRCAHPIVCHSRRVKELANGVLRLTGKTIQVTDADFEIENLSVKHSYGAIASGSANVMDLFKSEEGIDLDTTYTAKVAIYIKEKFEENHFQGKSVLYWHTYSNKAFTWNNKLLRTLEEK